MFRTLILVSLSAVSAFTSIQGQTLGAPEWSNVPFQENGKKPWATYGPYCVNGAAFALADVVSGKDYVGYIYPKNGPVVSKPVVFPQQKDHVTFSVFCVVGGKPCVLYSTWDKKTNVVTVFVQAYTASGFDPDGAPMKLCDLHFAKSYYGSPVTFSAMPSPDGSKMLFLFDDIQLNGFKLAMCWVVDPDLNLLWSGQYRIPMESWGSRTTNSFMDNGHLYMKVNGVAITADNVKEKNDGSLVAKSDAKYWKHSDKKWYDMHGDDFHQWDGSVHGMPGRFDGSPVIKDGQVVMAGLMMPEGKGHKDQQCTYVLLNMNEAFVPGVITSGSMSTPPTDDVRAMNDEAGNIYIEAFQEDGMSMLKLNGAGAVQWERAKPWVSMDGKAVGEQLFFVAYGTKAALNDLLEGKTPNLAARPNMFPIMVTWDADGNSTAMRVFPEDTELRDLNGGSLTLDDCGCYTALSTDKKHPGLVRVCLQK